jgi:tRNA-specific 2-thiouridylase
MSGGVDSSVSACLLKEQGYDVMGLFMRVGAERPEEPACAAESAGAGSLPGTCDAALPGPTVTTSALPRGAAALERTHQGCCSASDAADARFVAGMLGIPFYALNFKADFDRIIEYFADEYQHGRTPNPCVQCNNWLKFGKLVEYADAIGADYVATGHYARIHRDGGRVILRQGRDRRKDQSYFLYGVHPDMLRRAMFPVGDLEKDQVRAEAERFNLPVRNKPDSVEICFVPDRDYARVVRERRPEAFVPGDVVDAEGRVLGRHEGLANFTIGQRRGLGIAAGKPVYVTQLDVLNNTVVLAEREALLGKSLIATDPNWFCDPPAEPIRCEAKIRYQHAQAPCTARVLDDGRLQVDFDAPQSAITPGQAVVLYQGDLVLGGAWIEQSIA